MTERFMIPDDGIQLNAVLERPSEAPGPLVIFLHGFTGSMNSPHNISSCEAMREVGFATLRVDLYGHGGSGGTFREHTILKWIDNTLAVIDYARKLSFVTEIWLSGHSQGGLTAALAGAMEPDHVKGLILRAPAFMIPECARRGNLLGHSFDPLRVPDEIPLGDGVTLSGNYLRAAQTIHAEEAIERFPGPVLLLHGDADATVPAQVSVDAAAKYHCCRLEILPGETHHFDRDTERMNAIIREWLTEQRKAEAAR